MTLSLHFVHEQGLLFMVCAHQVLLAELTTCPSMTVLLTPWGVVVMLLRAHTYVLPSLLGMVVDLCRWDDVEVAAVAEEDLKRLAKEQQQQSLLAATVAAS